MISPWWFVLIFAGIALVVNILMYYIGVYGSGKRKGVYAYNKYLPPGFMIGIIWIVIFGCLGYSFYLSYVGDPDLLYNKEFPRKWSQATILTIVVASYCMLYPFLTIVVDEKYYQLLNFIALIMAYALGIVVIQEYVAAFWYVLPLIAWTTYICFADIMQGSKALHYLFDMDMMKKLF
jgi:tryptophan-rich sensory protein